MNPETKKVILESCVSILSEIAMTPKDINYLISELSLEEEVLEVTIEHTSLPVLLEAIQEKVK